MRLHPSHNKSMRTAAIAVATLAVIALLARILPALPGAKGIANYLPLHMLLETFAVVVAMLVFAVGWHAHSRNQPGNIVLLACAFLGVGLLDFAHMLSYAGMPDFVTPSNIEKSLDFWLAARFLAAAALLVAVLLPWRPFASATTRYKLLSAVIAATALAYWLFLFHQDTMPHTFVPGQGLTAFKIASEYAIIALNLATALMLYKQMRKPQPFNAAALFGAVCAMALSEFFFTLYADVTDVYNLMGHIYKGISYLFLYRAVFVSTVETPYRQLQLSRTKLRGTLDALPDLMWLKDAEGVYLECNPVFERLYGASRENIVGKTDYDFVEKELADFFREHDRKAMAAGKSSVNEEWLTFAENGYRGLFETVKTPMRDVAGNFVGVLGIARDITGHKQAEQALTLKNLVFDASIAANSIADLNGIITEANGMFLRIWGYQDKSEVIGKPIPHFLADMDLAAGIVAELDKTGQWKGEYTARKKDGSTFHAYGLATVVRDQDGKIIGYQSSVLDISERKQAEDTQRKLYQVVEQSPSSIVITDPDANIEYVNRAFVKETGYSLAEAMGKNPRVLNSGKNPKETYREMWSCLKRGEAWRGELVNRRKDGSEYVELAVISPVRLADGSVTNYLAIKENITERKTDEAKIKRLSRTYRLLSRVNEAIVRATNRSLLFEAVCNAAMTSDMLRFVWIGMLDKNEHRVIPMARSGAEQGYTSAFDIRLDDERCREWPIAKAILEGVHVVRQDIGNETDRAIWQDEAVKRGYRSAGMFPIREMGVVAGSINVYSADEHFFTQDIIELMLELAADVSFALDMFAEKKRREQAEDEIRRLNVHLERRVAERTHQLELVNKELEAFCYSVSHDLRAPLRSIDGFSQVLLKKYQGQLDATGTDWLERVRRATQHMGHLIDDMLRLSQVTRGSLKRDRVDLSAIAEQVAEELRKAHPERQVRFICQRGLAAHGDAGLLRIVMNNLLGNAWKYSGKKAAAEIEFGAQEDRPSDPGEERAFFVRDNGAGFNMDYAQKLFGAFQRLHGASEFEGTGIGLATVQRIVHRHHGKVWAEAKEEHGATFYFTLPQRERESREAA